MNSVYHVTVRLQVIFSRPLVEEFKEKLHVTSPSLLSLQRIDESFGMNVAGGAGSRVGDLPIFISAIKPDSVVGRCTKIQVSEYHICVCNGGM